MKRGLPALLLASLALGSSGCELVVYSDNLVNDNRHSSFVTKPASVMGVLGFVVGLPLDILAFPVTYAVYATQKARLGWPVARVATARKLARAVHAMLRTQQPWRDDPARGELHRTHAAATA